MHHRIKELQRSYRLRLLVCHIDVEDVVEPLGQVIKAALLNEVTLICGWSPEVQYNMSFSRPRFLLQLMSSILGSFSHACCILTPF